MTERHPTAAVPRSQTWPAAWGRDRPGTRREAGQTMESIYLASRYSRASEMQGVRDVVEVLGYKVISRWIDLHVDTTGGPQVGSFTPERLAADPTFCAPYAQVDYDDLMTADIVASFTCGSGGKGGRHVEFGIAVALGKRLIVVGPREHVFHTLPQVEWYPTWSRWVMALTKATQPDHA